MILTQYNVDLTKLRAEVTVRKVMEKWKMNLTGAPQPNMPPPILPPTPMQGPIIPSKSEIT